jgi:hypothetical protein
MHRIPATQDRLRSELVAGVKDYLGVQQSNDLQHLLRATQATFLEQPKLRLAYHFDIQPDVLIYDSALGTLGLVHIVCGDGDVENAVHLLIDRATYVRHLLLTDPKRVDRAAFSVELVIATPADEQIGTAVGNALRTTAGRTQYLQAIGVNVLRAGADHAFARADLRRAFPWLLVSTRNWYASDEAKPRPTQSWDGSPGLAVDSLTLRDYRLRGERRFVWSPVHRVHLVHGRNGSGKSALVEAIEYLLTGAVTRVGSADYDSVIRNRDATSPASISLGYRGGGSSGPFSVTGRATPAPMPPGLNAASFRLDQTVMDQLARATPSDRHNVFGQAFFPEAAEAYEAQGLAATEAMDAFKVLPESVRTLLESVAASSPDDGEAAVVGRLSALGDPTTPLRSGVISDCLPLPWPTLQVLGRLDPELETLISTWDANPPRRDDVEGPLKTLDDGLARLRAQAAELMANLGTAQHALGEWAAWQPSAGRQVDNFGETLNAWLERTALAELAERHYALARALKDAREHGWELDWDRPVGLFEPTPLTENELAALKQQGERWASERDAHLSQLSNQPRSRRSVAQQRSGRPARLSIVQVRALDAVSPWLYATTTTSPLGQILKHAIDSDTMGTFGPIVIGTENWATPLLKELGALTDAIRQLSALPETPTAWSAVQQFRQLNLVLEKYRALQQANQGVRQTFLTQLARLSGAGSSRLIDAINELMALFTPARFAYYDIRLIAEDGPERRLRLQLQDGRSGGTRHMKPDADLVFNTAELNAFTIALFLLCAPRIPNPLRMLVLDDPLQNMDELTVTYVARGLAKLVRLWPEDWRLLLLFHGEDALERFRVETPGAVYELPWLTPVTCPEARVIEVDLTRSSGTIALQDIGQFIVEQPA